MSKEKISGKVFDIALFKRLLLYIKNYRFAFIIATVSVILLAAFAAIRPTLLIKIVDDYISTKNSKQVLNFSLIMFGVLILEVIFQFLFIYFTNWLGQHIIKDIRFQLFKHISYFKMNYFNNTAIGKIVTRVVSDIETISSIFGQGLFMIISDLLKMLIVILVMLFINWKLALIVFAALPLLIYATKVFKDAMKGAFKDVRNEVSNLNSFVQERLTGMKIVQIFSREKIEYQEFKKINSKHKKAWIKTVWYNSIFFPIAEVVPSIALGFVVWYGGSDMIASGNTTAGEIIGFIMMNQMLFRPLRQIADKFNTLQMGMVAADRVFKIMDEEIKESENSLNKTNKRLNGNINFNDVHFSYIKGEEVLKGISFNVNKGESIALVGATGAGKSTIINLLNRFYTIDSGIITLDGKNINEFNLHHLRKQIAVVLQDVFLFSDTIFNNITLNNKNIGLEEVIKAAKQIGIHDFIMSLPNNYNYNVKERGVMLSTGQRQLIAFLRAFVNKPSILILDEATSSIDSQSEILIKKATELITKNRTSIIIAHRLATIKKADRIIVMDNGNIVEQGNHQELLDKKGFYSNLHQIQFDSKDI
ncbi:MAG: ABC transporter ATP-binding protein [Flavobacteriaceae bacterium]